MIRRTPRRFLTVPVLALTLSALMGPGASSQGREQTTSSRLTLQQAVERALDYHPSLQIAEAGVDVAAAAVGEAKAQWWPRIQLEASATRHQLPMLTGPIHAFTPDAIPPFDRTLYGGSAMAGFNVFDGGSRTARIGLAQAEARGASAQGESTLQTLIASVTVSYLRVLSARGVLQAHEDLNTALTAELERVNRRIAEGTAARVELLRAEAALAAAEADLAASAADLDVAERNLARLLGASVEETRVSRLASVDLTTAAREERERGTYQELASASNPHLDRARENLRAAESGRKLAMAQWWPSIELTGGWIGYGYPGGLSTEWQIGAKLRYPIFTGGARSKAVARAGAQADAAREQLRMEELSVEESVDAAVTVLHEVQSRVLAMIRAVDHQTEVVRIEQLALDAGAGTQIDYLRAEADLSRARAALVEMRHAEIAARVELARVTGELSQEWLDRAVEINQ
ncbi:MAG: TolC family protein [Gemmatimonadota bacterium]|nr:MAG: TolC family protein [Gemmatimonadota bacterium]